MAKNYTMAEVANIFAEKSDFEAMTDIGKRYPLLAIKMTALVTKAPEETADIFSYMPDYLSANKVNKAIKDGGEDVSDSDVEDDETTEAPAEKPAKKPVAKKEAKAVPKAKASTGSKDFDSMNNKQMYDLLGELGERKACKAEFGDLSKASMTAYLKNITVMVLQLKQKMRLRKRLVSTMVRRLLNCMLFVRREVLRQSQRKLLSTILTSLRRLMRLRQRKSLMHLRMMTGVMRLRQKSLKLRKMMMSGKSLRRSRRRRRVNLRKQPLSL